MGHKKGSDRADHKEAAANRAERARERELVKKPAFERRQRELERVAKRQKRNEVGQQVSNVSFEGTEDEERKKDHELKVAHKLKSKLNLLARAQTWSL